MAYRHLVACFACLAALASGCGSPSQPAANSGGSATESHDHAHDHAAPASLADAVAQIKTHLTTVKDAFAAGKPDDCDDALHELAEILEQVPDVAAKEKLPEADVAAIKTASSALMDALMKIHDGFHDANAKGSTYDDVKSVLEEQLAALEAKLPAASGTAQ